MYTAKGEKRVFQGEKGEKRVFQGEKRVFQGRFSSRKNAREGERQRENSVRVSVGERDKRRNRAV